MKSERGVTLTSIMIYVLALTVVVLTIGRITLYFYRNVNKLDSNAIAEEEYTKFNSYFTYEINVENNEVKACETEEDGTSYIIFSLTGNQYTYKNGNIYMNKTKINNNIQSCEFKYNENIITVNMKINEKDYNASYTVVK